MCVGDYTNQMWLSGFNDVGLTIIGKSADDMVALKDEDEGEFNRVLAHACGKMYDFSVRAKAETYGDQTRCEPALSFSSCPALPPVTDAVFRSPFSMMTGSSTPSSASSPSTLSRRPGACSPTLRCGDEGDFPRVCFQFPLQRPC